MEKKIPSSTKTFMSVLRRLIKGLLLFFYEPYAEGATDSEKTFNPDIVQVNVTVNGTTNKVFSRE